MYNWSQWDVLFKKTTGSTFDQCCQLWLPWEAVYSNHNFRLCWPLSLRHILYSKYTLEVFPFISSWREWAQCFFYVVCVWIHTIQSKTTNMQKQTASSISILKMFWMYSGIFFLLDCEDNKWKLLWISLDVFFFFQEYSLVRILMKSSFCGACGLLWKQLSKCLCLLTW